jgi:hypothetical protein
MHIHCVVIVCDYCCRIKSVCDVGGYVSHTRLLLVQQPQQHPSLWNRFVLACVQAPADVNLVAVLFACAPDQTARSGSVYSLWTQHLLAELPNPHNSLFEMNQRIAERMKNQTPGFDYVHYNQCYSFAKCVAVTATMHVPQSVTGTLT